MHVFYACIQQAVNVKLAKVTIYLPSYPIESQLPIRQLRPRLAETTNTIENGNCTNRVLAAGLSDLQRAEATVEFMNLFRQMLNEARFFSHDERSLRGYLIEDIEKKKLKAEELLNGLTLYEGRG